MKATGIYIGGGGYTSGCGGGYAGGGGGNSFNQWLNTPGDTVRYTHVCACTCMRRSFMLMRCAVSHTKGKRKRGRWCASCVLWNAKFLLQLQRRFLSCGRGIGEAKAEEEGKGGKTRKGGGEGKVATPGVLRGTTIVPWGCYGGRYYEYQTMRYKAGCG